MGFHPMRELRITDVELQKMIAPVLRKRLRKAGFAMGAASADGPPTYMFPINLDLAAFVTVIRREDGTWLFQQESGTGISAPLVVMRLCFTVRRLCADCS